MSTEITRPRFTVVLLGPTGRVRSAGGHPPAPRPHPAPPVPAAVKPGRGAAIRRINAARSKGYEGKPEDHVVVAETDLPTKIVQRTVELMEVGALEPQVKDGIAAQAILERRQERMEDRAFMLNLARAMAGGGIVQPRIVGETVDGNEVLALAPEHMRVG